MVFVRRFGILIIGILLVISGVVVNRITPPVASFGWTAYAPLTSETYVPGFPRIASVLVVLGLVLIAGWIGFRIGRRRSAGPSA
jgi:heme/copper-type cytochrome/quinol oxidase subunit 1